MNEERSPYRRLSRSLAFVNPWMEVRDDRVVRPDGSEGPYAYVHFRNLAVSILPVHDDGSVVLVGQWRYPIDRYSWEIPAGGCHLDEGEAPLETAHRELAEETGLAAAEMVKLGTGHLSNSISDEVSVMFLARGLTAAGGEHHRDPGEDLRLRRVPFEELLGRIDEGEITDALTLTTVLRYQLLRARSA